MKEQKECKKNNFCKNFLLVILLVLRVSKTLVKHCILLVKKYKKLRKNTRENVSTKCAKNTCETARDTKSHKKYTVWVQFTLRKAKTFSTRTIENHKSG